MSKEYKFCGKQCHVCAYKVICLRSGLSWPEVQWGANPTEKIEIRTDRVIADTKTIPNTWSFQLQIDNGYRPASVSVTASKNAENCKFIAALLPDTERFIVCLLENGNIAPSTNPKQHKSLRSAMTESKRLAKLHGKTFIVLQAELVTQNVRVPMVGCL